VLTVTKNYIRTGCISWHEAFEGNEVRSRVFEEALINVKLQRAIFGVNKRRFYAKFYEDQCWPVERVLSKEFLNIIADVLNLCTKPQNKAKIARNLDPELVNGCIQYLLAQGLLNEVDDKFATTKKGRELVELLTKLRGFFGVDPLE
jgi:predicted transcriptional regulator